jgi:diguanylate cyclase (GGDEF)-like protein
MTERMTEVADAQTDLRAAIQGKNLRAATVVAELAGGSSARVLVVDDAFGILAALERASTPEWMLDDLLGAITTDGAEVARLRRLVADGAPTEVRIEPGRCGPEGLLARLAPVDLNADGRPSHLVCTLAPYPGDLPASAEDELAGGLDPLTGLLNRAQLLRRLESAFARATNDNPVAVLFADVDHFKLVNDSLGHEAGDAVLLEVAARLRACTRPEDTVARLGGDEFVLVLEGTSAREASDVALRSIQAISSPIALGRRELSLTASIGLAVSGPEAASADQLLRNADTALYEAKGAGRARAQAFNSDIHRRVLRRIELESEMRRALREDEFALHYQPQVDLISGRIVGVEALLRWAHPTLGSVPPSEFVPIAEDTGLILALGRWVLREALDQLAAWSRGRECRGLGTVTINVSPVQLGDSNFVDDVRCALRDSGVEPSAVCLELTESSLMQGPSRTIDVLADLQSLGVYLAIDDFGTGHSSLARLRDLPVEIVKIDRSFVDGLGRDPHDSAIVASIMSLAFAMGLHAIAEGVEQPAQAKALTRLGCTTAQGYLFSPAQPPSAIPALCATRLWRPTSARPSAEAEPARSPTVHGRRGRRRFIDEFLDHMGVHMYTVEGRAR